MNDRNQDTGNHKAYTGPGHGMQGIDKAPGEEPARDADQFVAQTQKGKNKVDGDPSQDGDKPLPDQDIQR